MEPGAHSCSPHSGKTPVEADGSVARITQSEFGPGEKAILADKDLSKCPRALTAHIKQKYRD